MPPDVCPNCGAEVPPKARACPECGSDERTGWSDRATSQRLDLPEDDFDYDEFVQEEFGESRSNREVRPRGIPWHWWLVAVIVVLAFLWLIFPK